MAKVAHSFQVFAKPGGAGCNLACHYCYYLEKKELYPENKSLRMQDELLERYIVQHIKTSTDPVINFSWHGGEPTVLGLDYFKKIVSLQNKYKPANRIIKNGMQTNGTLLNEAWCRFLSEEGFTVGVSLDGPQKLHDRYRVTRDQKPTYEQVIRGLNLLKQYGISCEILCVVNANNVKYPLEIYRFFEELGITFISFIPLVEQQRDSENGVSRRSVSPLLFGEFLCAIFTEWKERGIGKIKIQIIEEAARTAFNQEHSLCIFRKRCGYVPVIECNGDFYSCDHYVDAQHCLGNIQDKSLLELLESPAQIAFGRKKCDTLPHYCRMCEVRDMCNGECPKYRFLETPDGEPGLNYLCEGYKLFFTFCKPFVEEIASLWHQQNLAENKTITYSQTDSRIPKTGRNDTCPCGSGKKYKHCCLTR